MAISCKQIADMVGISRQAASSVLNHQARCKVSCEKKAKILELAQKYNFVQNNSARTLRRGKSGIIGILTGGLHVAQVGVRLIMLDRVLRENGFLPVIIYTRSEYENIADGIRSLVQQNVEGLILHNITPQNNENGLIGRLIGSGLLKLVPCIITGSGHDDCSVHTAGIQYKDACRSIAERAAQRHFSCARAFFRNPVLEHHYEAERMIRKLLSGFDGPILPEAHFYRRNVLAPDRYQQDLLRDVREAMKELRPGTLYLCETDMCAVQVCLELLQRFGKIPEDSGVIAFDNTTICSSFTPGISAIEPDEDLLAQKTWELLHALMKDPAMPVQHIQIPAKLTLRETF